MPQISTNRLGRATIIDDNTTSAEAAYLLLQLANDLEEEICLALLEENVALAERLVAPQAQLKRLSQIFGLPKPRISAG
ncbi:hypothetical protein [Leisingera sp. ANG-Vp]|uniref:hypothetical protein n=1 Tax=Leisingera sp. ANG-Vp TaxID=1577896 RepID=UPI00057E6356|nr:hypothetical protein [Leisingera sp. ANG-Vp]KIC14072.1 hypothetical protein RA20_21630 [Leisingera sp. ANG-Vp]